MDFERFYGTMTGQIEPEEGYPVEDCYAGACEELYSQVSDARRYISAKLQGNLNGESPQVLSIINAYEAMQRIFCERAFEYGARYGRGEIDL
jgi:hypothetical protein